MQINVYVLVLQGFIRYTRSAITPLKNLRRLTFDVAYYIFTGIIV